jgi:hypothetical protein
MHIKMAIRKIQIQNKYLKLKIDAPGKRLTILRPRGGQVDKRYGQIVW